MPEITLIVDELSGDLLLESPDHVSADLLEEITTHLGAAQELGCARPLDILPPPHVVPAEEIAVSISVRVAGYYHNSLTEGPGRRSSVLFQFCPLACKGCWVTNLHDPNAGALIPADHMAKALLDPAFKRDGVSILGGEPFVQAEALMALIRALRARDCQHILCYSRYTYEALRSWGARQPAIKAVLDELDILVDGPYIESQAGGAGAWTGSGNQRVINLCATRRKGQIVLYSC
ncbi:MAG: radical SAM protein [Pyrinomonadaceae bacterium MAG19_C2-C3]|nr:radical SAM protein [Pyrinomonadaceae bacterium MAG19_C2-C3]